jgi:hypothetical protein
MAAFLGTKKFRKGKIISSKYGSDTVVRLYSFDLLQRRRVNKLTATPAHAIKNSMQNVKQLSGEYYNLFICRK